MCPSEPPAGMTVQPPHLGVLLGFKERVPAEQGKQVPHPGGVGDRAHKLEGGTQVAFLGCCALCGAWLLEPEELGRKPEPKGGKGPDRRLAQVSRGKAAGPAGGWWRRRCGGACHPDQAQ